MAHDVFICYAREDERIADALCQALEDRGIRCWYAPRDVPFGAVFEEAIVDAIYQSQLLLLVLSSHSNASAHVTREIQNAFADDAQVPVLPFRIEDVPLNKALKYYIGSLQWFEALTPPIESHFERLIKSVQARLQEAAERRRALEEARRKAEDEAQRRREAEEALSRAEEERQRAQQQRRAETKRRRRKAEGQGRREIEAEAKPEQTQEEDQRRHEAVEAERQRPADESDSSTVKPVPAPPALLAAGQPRPGAAGTAPRRAGKRALLVVIACVAALAAIAFVWMRRTGEDTPATPHQTPPEANANQAGRTTGTPSATATPQAPPGMVYVEGGEFTMGRDKSDGGDEYEHPAHKETVKPFFIDIYEVTREEYKRCVDDARRCPTPQGWVNGNYPEGTARQPVTGVDWDAANAYAKWAKKRLPTEEEWEFAARGKDGEPYPWGKDWQPGLANANGAKGLVNVEECKDRSSVGAFGMIGNAWEWTASKLTAYPGARRLNLPSGDKRVIRGGSYAERAEQATTYYRGFLSARGSSYDRTGFRCVKDVAGQTGAPED